MRSASRACAVVFLLLADAGAASAEDSDPRLAELERLQQTVEGLERRIFELEAQQVRASAMPGGGAAPGSSDWADRLRISGSTNLSYLAGRDDSLFDESSSDVRDARLFIEADLGGDARLGDTRVYRNASLFFEWNLVRLSWLSNDVGELYVDVRGLFDSDWLNAQVGRFQIPFGESYLRYSAGFADNPFISNSVGGPWFWDEGVRLFGGDDSGRFGYVASLSNGDTSFNGDSAQDKQLTLKLFVEPAEFLRLSVSGLRSGHLGSSSTPAASAIWLGESWFRAFGNGSAVTSYDHGVPLAAGPNQLDGVTMLGADAVLHLHDLARLWLAYGIADADSSGADVYDRELRYWIAELVLQGALVSDTLAPFYLALRANGLGTYDPDEGYLLDFRRARTLGYNMESLEAWSIAAGWPLSRNLTLRAEYSYETIDVVRGVTAAIRDAAEHADYFGLDVGVRF